MKQLLLLKSKSDGEDDGQVSETLASTGRMLFTCFLIFLLSVNHSSFANYVQQETITITGTVTDPNGIPFPGIVIMEQGTNNGTQTNFDGKYSIVVFSNESILEFSYLGMLPVEHPVRNRINIDVEMKEDSQALDEVVVVAYGTQKKATLTGSVSTIGGEEVERTNSPSIAQALQGKIAGVQIRQADGQPGSFSSNVQIRGFGNPLYVIDGVVRDAGSGAAEFQRLNPDDIKNITVLKDGAAALYGMNAANGAIIVTTKIGTKGKPKFTYSGTVTSVSPTSLLEVMDAAQHLDIKNEMSMNAGTGPAITPEELELWRSQGAGYESTDWMDAAFKERATTTNHNLSAQGGNDQITYYTSFGYLNEGDLTKGGDFSYDRYTFRTNLSANLSDHLVLDLRIGGRYDVTKSPSKGIFNLLFQSTMMEPTYSVYSNDNPNFFNSAAPFDDNPIAGMYSDVSGGNSRTARSLLTSATLTYSMPWIDGLKFRVMGSYDAKDSRSTTERRVYNLYSYDDQADEINKVRTRNNPATLSSHMDINSAQNIQSSITYETTIKENHNFALQALNEINKGRYDYNLAQREYTIYAKPVIGLGSEDNLQNDGGYGENANVSYLGRLNYNFKEKYLLEAGFRYNGSYRYAPDKRWGFFPTLSGGWRISEEAFIKDNLDFISDLKLRASYGATGMDVGDEFQFVEGYTLGAIGYEFVDGVQMPGVHAPVLMNRNLTWVESAIFDVGIDLDINQGMFGLTLDYYQRNRTGLLATSATQITNTFGATLPQENLNADLTRGIDLAISHRNTIGELSYHLQGNFNFARTMLTDIVRGDYGSSMDKWRGGQEGRWEGTGWGYTTMGQYQSMEEIYNEPVIQTGDRGNTRTLPGDFYLEDLNGDGYINGNDTKPMFYGLNMPALNFGLSVGANWRNFDLYALLQGSSAYTLEIPDNLRIAGPWNGNSSAYLFNRWHREDPFDINSAWVPGRNPSARSANFNPPGNGAGNTDRNTIDGSYLRVKTVQLGYTLPVKMAEMLQFENAKIFVNAYNIFTFFDPFLKNEVKVDPEKTTGQDNRMLNYPLSKSVAVGINISF